MTPASLGDSAGVSLAVLTNRFEAVARKMTNTLFRTARSGVINTARDFSCCIVTADDQLLVSAESLPIHVMTGPDLMSRAMKGFHPDLRPGDAFLHNSPYHGNSHAADHTVLVPVIDGGVHRFTVLVKAHVADCGNAAPTTLMPTARDVYEEGALIFPCVKCQTNYEDVEDFVRMCRARIRAPGQWWGDQLGLIGAARIGEREVLKLGSEIGWEALDEYVGRWFDYSEARMAAAIRGMPAGTATTRNSHDPVPGAPDGVAIQAKVVVDPAEAKIEVDLRENPDCVPAGVNLTEATSSTACKVGIFNGLHAGVPANGGSFRRLRILLRENCVAGIPRHPASCSTATTGVADRVANCVQRALAEIAEGLGMAEVGLSIPASAAFISGHDPRRGGEPFVNMMTLGQNGGAGTPHSDGWLTIAHVGNGGLIQRDSTEIDELLHPIRIDADRLIPDTEGPGRYRGAPGAQVEWGPVGCEIEAIWSSDGCVFPALGARGGGSGALASQFVRGADGEARPRPGFHRTMLADGERVVSHSCGGGGYGPPLERDPGAVARDVADGWISRERAHTVYGVEVDSDGVVDEIATASIRRAQ